jgi:hypothetical protein
MTHNEEENSAAFRRYLAFDDGDDVGDDERGWSGKALFGVFVYRASPASLVETMHFDATRSKVGKEFIISIAVVAQTVDEDELGHGLTVRLGAC